MKDFNLDLLNRLLFKQCDSDIKDVIYKKSNTTYPYTVNVRQINQVRNPLALYVFNGVHS